MKNMKKFILKTFVKVSSNNGFWTALAFLALIYMLLTGENEGSLMAMALVTGVEGGKHVTVQIIHKDGTEKKLEYDTDLEYLADLLLEKELVTGYTSEEYGFTIEGVDGIVLDWATDSAYWALYEGDTYATTSASGIVLTDGGVYKLVYETF